MSNSIWEIVIKFFGTLIIMLIIGYFLSIGIVQAFAISIGMMLLDTIFYIIRKTKKSKK